MRPGPAYGELIISAGGRWAVLSGMQARSMAVARAKRARGDDFLPSPIGPDARGMAELPWQARRLPALKRRTDIGKTRDDKWVAAVMSCRSGSGALVGAGAYRLVRMSRW